MMYCFQCKKKTVNIVMRNPKLLLSIYTSYPNVTAITAISKPKNASNFRSPYLSKNKNVNVSTMVINVPAHNGTLNEKESVYALVTAYVCVIVQIPYALFDSKKIAIAVPITSCMSEPIIAISIIIHSTRRGNL